MDYVAISIDHNIAIVPVLDLQDVACHRVCRHRLDEIQPRSLEAYGVLSAVFCNKEILKIVDFCSTHFIPRGCIRNNVNDPTLHSISKKSVTRYGGTYPRTCRSDSVREEVQHQADGVENVLEHSDDLKR